MTKNGHVARVLNVCCQAMRDQECNKLRVAKGGTIAMQDPLGFLLSACISIAGQPT
jgi:hypothetical protein